MQAEVWKYIFTFYFPLLLLLSCYENVLCLVCFCWIKHLPPNPTTTSGFFLAFSFSTSLLRNECLTPLHVIHLRTTLDTAQLLALRALSTTISSGPRAAASSALGPVTSSLGMTAPLQPPPPPTTSSPPQTTPLPSRAEEGGKGRERVWETLINFHWKEF